MINGIQESIKDIFIVCDQILPFVNKVKVLENDEIALIRYSKKVVKSDHKVLELGLEIKIHIENKHFLSSDEPIAIQYKRWKRNVNIAIHAHFRKIRLTETKQDTKIEVLMNERKNIMKKKTLSKSEEEKVHEIESHITKEIADIELEKLLKVTGELDTDHNTSIWKEMRKSYPKNYKPIPTGEYLIWEKNITIKHFEHKMRKREVKKEVADLIETEKL